MQNISNNPLVSVCIPTYNGAVYLQDSLNSVKAQTYKNIEVIISDDCSTDDTLNLILKFKEEVNFPIFIHKNRPRGIGANWNNCLRNSNGDYIKFLFQDDILYQNCITEMVKVFAQNSEIGLVGSKREFIIEQNLNMIEISSWINKYGDLQKEFHVEDGKYFLTKNIFGLKSFISHPKNKIGEPSTVLFKRKLINEIGYFNESLHQILDYEFWYRILKKYPIVIIDKPLVKFRLHSMQATSINKNKNIDDYKRYEKILYREYFKFLHPCTKNRLYQKFHPLPRLKNQIKNILKR